MTKRDRAVKAQGTVISARREGNVKVAIVLLNDEMQRGPREVRVHAMANDVSAIKAALAQKGAA